MAYKLLADKWLIFAADDLKIIKSVIEEEVYHLACFHAQQSVEKSLKSFIIFYKGRIDKVHSLVELLNEAVKLNRDMEKYKNYCLILDRYYISTRYPDAFPGILPAGLPGKERAEEALKYAKEIFDFIKGVLEK